jgi:hypothetical protein
MRRLLIVVFAVASVASPAAASAQDTFGGWRGLDASGLDTVYVTERDGSQTEGKLVGFNADSVVLMVDGSERRIEAARVSRIDRRGDSLRNGALIGLGVGVLMGLFTSGFSDCPGDNRSGNCPGTRAAIFAVSSGFYSAVGAGIDALVKGRTRLYDAARPSAAGQHPRGRQLAFNVGVSW